MRRHGPETPSRLPCHDAKFTKSISHCSTAIDRWRCTDLHARMVLSVAVSAAWWSDVVPKSTVRLTSDRRHVSRSSQPRDIIAGLCAFDRMVRNTLRHKSMSAVGLCIIILASASIQCRCVTAPRGRVQCIITFLKAVERLLRHRPLLHSCCTVGYTVLHQPEMFVIQPRSFSQPGCAPKNGKHGIPSNLSQL